MYKKGGVMKQVVLKTGEMLVLCNPTNDDAQGCADHANAIMQETNFVLANMASGLKTVEDEIKWFDSVKNSPRQTIVLAKLDEKIVGIGNVSGSSKNRIRHRCQIGISVQKAYWGKGIASKIMQELIDFAISQEYEQMELEVVDGNTSAQNLYKKFGYVESGRVPNGMKYVDVDNSYADLIFMYKDLRKRN